MSDRLYIFGHLESRRTRFLVESLKQLSFKWQIISWDRVLSGSDWYKSIEKGSSVRIETPGQDFETEKRILGWGVGIQNSSFNGFSQEEIDSLAFEKGRILAINQWYSGWSKILLDIKVKLADRGARYLNPPEDIRLMFDKPGCNQLLRERGAQVPPILGKPGSCGDVFELMDRARCNRVFLKPCFSSSASGIVAMERTRDQVHGFSTIELQQACGHTKLFNSRKVRRYSGLGELRPILDAICKENVYLERWLPKAGFAGKRFDLRVVVVAGRARHVILRLGDHAMTNLHLGARRGDTEALRAQMGDATWNSALGLAEKAIQAFPGSLYGGIDLLISPGWKKAYVLEVNAFGDFLPQATWNGMDTFTCEFKSWKEHLNNQVSTIGW